MSIFFFEILTEEIPARSQSFARGALKEFLEKKLQEKDIPYDNVSIETTPRRLWGVIEGLPQTLSQKKEIVKGPRTDAPSEHITGFLKTNGISGTQDCEILQTPKGAFLSYEKVTPPQQMKEVMGPFFQEIIQTFSWPKSMRWDRSSFKWVRPIRGLITLFDDQEVSITLGSGDSKILSQRTTRGHRYFSSPEIMISQSADYSEALKKVGVVSRSSERKKLIENALKQEAHIHGFQVDWDEDLLEEVTGLVECPFIIKGDIEKEFMQLPPKLLVTVMRVHQRYFALKDAHTQEYVPFFLLVSDRPVSTAEENIRLGNENVLRARLRDAQFFFDQDSGYPLSHFVDALKERHFFADLGSMFDKAQRLASYATNGFLESLVDKTKVTAEFLERGRRAGFLAKGDLATQMVGEFPELQGYMGSIYAQQQKESQEVVDAIRVHYELPNAQETFGALATFLGMADRLDTLVGFFASGIIPTGSKDPYALRRAAIGVVTLLSSLKKPVSLEKLVSFVMEAYHQQNPSLSGKLTPNMKTQLLEFLKDRLKKELRQKGFSQSLLDAVVSDRWYEDLPGIYVTLEDLGGFLTTSFGQETYVLAKRISSILDKNLLSQETSVERAQLSMPEEISVWEAIQKVKKELESTQSVKERLLVLGSLTQPFHLFFENILVNDQDPVRRLNRQRLLKESLDLFEGSYLLSIEALS